MPLFEWECKKCGNKETKYSVSYSEMLEKEENKEFLCSLCNTPMERNISSHAHTPLKWQVNPRKKKK